MNTDYRYKLEKNSKKHPCPGCGKRRFVRYVDIEAGEYLPIGYGRCDRESKCGYFLNPYENGYAKEVWKQENGITQSTEITVSKQKYFRSKPKPKPIFFPVKIFKRTRYGYEKNVFIQNLMNRVAFPFETVDIEKAISLYHLGTVQNGYRTGAVTFPFIDMKGNVRTIQVKQFDKANHTTGTDFLHSIIEKHHTRNNKPLPGWLEDYNKNETKVSCLFGAHLLNKYPHNPIALVEAPKTAVYGALYFGLPEQPTNLLWLAVYNLSSLNFDKCKALKGRDVYLFPDLSKDGKAFKLWGDKAEQIQKQLQGTYFTVSDLLEQLAPEQDKDQGNDIADYLIKQDWRQFRKKKQPQHKPELIGATENLIKPYIQKEISESLSVKKLAKVSIQKKVSEPKELPKVPKLPTEKKLFSKPLPKVEVFDFKPMAKERPESWSNDISGLENYFAGTKLPTNLIQLNPCSTITNVPKFVESHLTIIKANNGNKTFLPYLNRLQELKQILTINSN